MLDGFLVARSDRSAVRFGHGLSTAELVWLRGPPPRCCDRAVGHTDSKSTSARRLIPTLGSKHRAPMFGAALGIVLAHLIGGPLAVCAAVPFLEHVLCVGGVLGFAIAMVLSRRFGQRVQTGWCGSFRFWRCSQRPAASDFRLRTNITVIRRDSTVGSGTSTRELLARLAGRRRLRQRRVGCRSAADYRQSCADHTEKAGPERSRLSHPQKSKSCSSPEPSCERRGTKSRAGTSAIIRR